MANQQRRDLEPAIEQERDRLLAGGSATVGEL
jgi:hypothetical protein